MTGVQTCALPILVGLILKQIGTLFNIEFLIYLGGFAQLLMGAGIGVGVAYALESPVLILISSAIIGAPPKDAEGAARPERGGDRAASGRVPRSASLGHAGPRDRRGRLRLRVEGRYSQKNEEGMKSRGFPHNLRIYKISVYLLDYQ